ncbi:acyl-CoA synthetase [Maricaulaceae bacterium NA33B04]|nr:acyl-CoA synthetase [Maricaulaceae bacterium NA33B04]
MPGGFPKLATLSDIEVVEATPLAERLDAADVFGVLKAAAGRHGDKICLIDIADPSDPATDRVWSYREAFAQITRTANALHKLGQGKPVGYLLPNLAETHFVLWGAAAGAGAAPVNPLLSADVIVEILAAAGAGCLVTTAPGTELYETAMAACDALGGLPLITVGEAGSLRAATEAEPDDSLTYASAQNPEDIAAYFHTGGTTGAPKLAQQSKANQAAMAWMLRHTLDLGCDDVVLTGLPLFHANAAILTGLAPLAAGATLVLGGPDGFRNKVLMHNFWRVVERYGVTVFSGVPTIFSSLLDHPVKDANVSSLRYGLVGAAPMPRSVIETFQNRTGIKILELYGMTESTCVSTCNPRDGDCRVGSIGLRLPYHQVKIARVDAHGDIIGDASPEEAGVLCLKGPTVIPGYKQVERNEGAFLDGGWLNSGDLGRIDKDGYVWLTGRAKDLIIRSGHNIDPGLIEEVLSKHDQVELVAAVGQPDTYAGEVPVAYVTLRQGASVTCNELESYARGAVAERPAAPKAVRILDEMPVTAVGKIFKPRLREHAAECAARAALNAIGHIGVQVIARTDKQIGLVVEVANTTKEDAPAVTEALEEFSFQTVLL